MAKKYNYNFIRKHSQGGGTAVRLAILSGGLFVVDAVISFAFGGEAGVYAVVCEFDQAADKHVRAVLRAAHAVRRRKQVRVPPVGRQQRSELLVRQAARFGEPFHQIFRHRDLPLHRPPAIARTPPGERLSAAQCKGNRLPRRRSVLPVLSLRPAPHKA